MDTLNPYSDLPWFVGGLGVHAMTWDAITALVDSSFCIDGRMCAPCAARMGRTLVGLLDVVRS